MPLRTPRQSPPQRPRSRSSRIRRPDLESLEGRALLATLSVTNASMNEIGDASAFVAPGSGGLSSPKDLTLGPDGNLYVTSAATNSVLRYNATTGALIGTFVAPNSGGLVNPFGIAFGPDGNLYVSSLDTDSILRFQGPSGPSPGSPLPSAGQEGATFVAPGNGGLDNPFNLAFGPDGDLYVASTLTNQAVLRFGGTAGSFVSTVVTTGEGGLAEPRGLAFDQDGRLYVADANTNSVHRYDSLGQYLDDPVAATGTTVRAPIGIAFDAQGSLLISSRDTNAVVRDDRGFVVTLSAAIPTPVTVDYLTADGTAAAGADYSAQAGTITFAPGQTSRRVLLTTFDDLTVEGNETFAIQLSNPTGGATIANGNATVTLVDDDITRQLSISDSSGAEGDSTVRYRGAFVTGLPGAHFIQVAFGPDGNLYTAVGTGTGYNTMRRYDGTTGTFIDTFMPQGKVNGVRDILFRDGFMYVASEYTDEVIRFDATTGEFSDVFVSAGNGGINGPHGMSFGPDANADGVPELYVCGRDGFNVVRYDGVTGQPLGTYVATGSGGLSWPEGIAFDPTGTYLFVASAGSNQVLKYNAMTGAYVGVGASTSLSAPKGVTFGGDGLMYVASAGNDRIIRFTAAGTYVDDYVSAGSGGLDDPHRIAFGPDGALYVAGINPSEIMRFSPAPELCFTVTLSAPSSLQLTVNYATADGSAVTGGDYTATTGTVSFEPGVTSKTIRVPTTNDGVTESTEAFTVNLSNALGASISDGQGVGTIQDEDQPAKFHVVNDATPSVPGTNTTYEYGTTGGAITSRGLALANLEPRGAASNAAGTRTWFVDVNKNVYVYDAGGVLLGSWAAGGLASNAKVEGIATNGTDVWIVDAQQDRVFKYAGAASRLSGSQNAASSFALNNSNSSPKDVVTDGTNLWVVNDSILDKVFKYTLSGSLAGSWTISGAGSSPTGITLDPSGGGTLWVVDSGTDRVYQFDNARSRTSGSQSPTTSFALAAGNTNPQGIADPPVAASPTTKPAAITETTLRQALDSFRPARAGAGERTALALFAQGDHPRGPVVRDNLSMKRRTRAAFRR